MLFCADILWREPSVNNSHAIPVGQATTYEDIRYTPSSIRPIVEDAAAVLQRALSAGGMLSVALKIWLETDIELYTRLRCDVL